MGEPLTDDALRDRGSMRKDWQRGAGACRICDTLPADQLVELDLLMADPRRWPRTAWRIFDPPKGVLPASYRRYGAVNVGRDWLTAHGWTFSNLVIRRHYRFDVPLVAIDPAELVHRGLIAGSDGRVAGPVPEPLDATAFLRYYNEGIKLGIQGLELLTKRVQKLIDTEQEVPLALIKQIVDTGAKLAMSQASIKAAGKGFGGDDGDENEGFRIGAGDDASPRIGHSRVRTIDGERVPVVDEGPADRADYNERARQEGRPLLPG